MDQDGSAGRAQDAGVDPAVLPVLLAQATLIHRRATGEEEYEGIWPLMDDARAFGRGAFAAAAALLASTDPSERAVGCDLLGTLCNPDEDHLGPEVAIALIALAEHEDDTDVQWSIARALGYAGDPRGLATLTGLVAHPDSDVRYQVALALPSCQGGAYETTLVQALIHLMEDPDGQIRDWATFGPGSLTEIDGPAVREALFRRLEDNNRDARDEAIFGLARRRDPRALPLVVSRLQQEEVGKLAVEAAAYLADKRLLDPLRALESWWDLDAGLLGEALAACDPERRAREVADQAEFLGLLEAGLTAVPEVSVWIFCESLGRDVTVKIERGGEVGRYDFQALLMNRAGGDVRTAVDAVLSDLSQ